MKNHTQLSLIGTHELIIDLFAGGGGASSGIEKATGRSPDIAVNHDADAVAMHQANHPDTRHFVSDVFEVNPEEVTQGRPVGMLWASPDCKHFSKAKGGKPVSKRVRSLAWVVVKWAKRVRPRVIFLENVEEFQTWGPLTRDNKPCPVRKGKTFEQWIGELRRLGYRVEWKELRACDYGAPTIRKRLFLIARCDGRPIAWPRPTHADPNKKRLRGEKKLLPWRTAADCIDWNLQTPSIFLTKEEGRAIGVRRPLADNTMARIARGMQRYVIDAAEPFIIQTGYGERVGQQPRVPDIKKPLGTVVAGGVKHAVVMPYLTEHANASHQRNMPADQPMRTIMAEVKGGHFALVSAFLAKHYGGNYTGPGTPLDAPAATVTTTDHHALITSNLLKLRGTCKDGQSSLAPMPTITAGGMHIGEVRAFLVKYYGTDQDPKLREPLHTITTKPRFGLVTVAGTDYVIADIGMRMLEPRELYQAQGFPSTYIIDRGADGKKLSKAAQVRMCGNSVCPPLAAALVGANIGSMTAEVAA